MLHHIEDMETVKGNLDTALRNAIKEINVRMASIETDIKRIRNAREGEKEQRRRVRREVVTYYEGYSEKVDQHKNDLDTRIAAHHDNCSNLLFREEITLEQYRGDLKQLCHQIERILSVKDCVEMGEMMVPVAKRLEKISEQIMNTGKTILYKLQFVPRRISNGSVPGYISSFTVCHDKSFAVIDKPIYEKVLCTIPLHLADENGMLLDIFHDLDIKAEMTVYEGKSVADLHPDKDNKSGVSVDVTVECIHSGGGEWRLKFYSPNTGVAQLSVKIDEKHIRNSPYVVNVKALSLEDDDAYVKMSDINANVYKSVKKCVTFDTKYFEI